MSPRRLLALLALAAIVVDWSACDSAPAAPQGGGLPNPSTLVLWRAKAATTARPLIVGNRIYVLSWEGNVVTALDINTGSVRWKASLPPSATGAGEGIGMAGGRLVIGDGDGYGLDTASGNLVWRFVPRPGYTTAWERLATDGNTVFFGASGGYVFAADGATGEERWRAKVTGDTDLRVHSPTLADRTVYGGFTDLQVRQGPGVAGRVFGGVVAIDAATGAVRWTTVFPHPDSTRPTYSSGAVSIGARVFAGSADGSLYVLDAATGVITRTVARSQFILPQPVPSDLDNKALATDGSSLFVGSLYGTVSSFGASDLQRRWIVDTSLHGSVIELTVDADFVYAMHFGGQMTVLRVSDGKPAFLVDASARLCCFAALFGGASSADGRVYVGGIDEIYALRKP